MLNKAIGFRPTDDILKRVTTYRLDTQKANGGSPTTMTDILQSLVDKQLATEGYPSKDNL